MIVQPIAQGVPAFDAKNEQIFKFVSNGGNQIVANRLVIRNNDTEEIIYNQKITTYKFEHLLPANILTNGVYYNFYFQTYDDDDNESVISNIVSFMCYDTPKLEITNIPINGIIKNSNFILNIKYSQIQKELLNVSKVLLFNDLGNKIFESENIYNIEEPPIEFTYELKGLDNNTTYQVQIIANTVNETVIESLRYIFTVRYDKAQIGSLLELKNNCKEGCVEIKNNFIVVDTEQNPENLGTNPKYRHDGKLYLTEEGTYLSYIKGFNIKENFTAKFFIENPNLGNLITLSNYEDKIEINLVIIENIYYLELNAFNHNDNDNAYVLYSNPISNKNKFLIWIRKKDGLFDIKIDNQEAQPIDTGLEWNVDNGVPYDSDINLYWEE